MAEPTMKHVSLAHAPGRWRRYILDALVETTIARDEFLFQPVEHWVRRR